MDLKNFHGCAGNLLPNKLPNVQESAAAHWFQWRKAPPLVAMGTYVQVLFVLGLPNDLINMVKDDLLGRKLQDAGLVSSRKRIKSSRI